MTVLSTPPNALDRPRGIQKGVVSPKVKGKAPGKHGRGLLLTIEMNVDRGQHRIGTFGRKPPQTQPQLHA